LRFVEFVGFTEFVGSVWMMRLPRLSGEGLAMTRRARPEKVAPGLMATGVPGNKRERRRLPRTKKNAAPGLFTPGQGVQDYAGEDAQYAGDDEQGSQDCAAYGQAASRAGNINDPEPENEPNHHQDTASDSEDE